MNRREVTQEVWPYVDLDVWVAEPQEAKQNELRSDDLLFQRRQDIQSDVWATPPKTPALHSIFDPPTSLRDPSVMTPTQRIESQILTLRGE